MSYDRRVKDMFLDFDKDKDGILHFEDFLSYNLRDITGSFNTYYCKQFITGLENLRYRKNMTGFADPLPPLDKSPEMMRYLICQCPEVYEELFSFV